MRYVLIVGSESTGSRLVSATVAHVLGVVTYGDWDAFDMVSDGDTTVVHRSLPHGHVDDNRHFIDIKELIQETLEPTKKDFVQVVITTRDQTISTISKCKTHNQGNLLEATQDMIEAGETLENYILDPTWPYFIFSYETAMFLKGTYFKLLYRFLNINSNYVPPLLDGNVKYIGEW